MPRAERQIKVLAYTDSAIFSGAESLFCDLLSNLAEDERFQLASAAPPANRVLTSALAASTGGLPEFEVPAQRLRLAAFDLYNPRRQGMVRAALRQSGADVIFLNLPSAEYGSTPLLVRRAGVPVVGLMHISGTMGDLGFRLGRMRELLARRAASRLDSVLLLSAEACSRYRNQWHPESTEMKVLHPPLPIIESSSTTDSRDRFNLPRKRRLIGIIGRLTMKQKGHDTFVAAAALMSRERGDLDFVVVGDGKDRARIEDMIRRMGLTDRFHFLGQVSDIPAVLSAIDLIAIPSRFEGLPLVALEALVAGVPGVVSSVDGLCDVWPEEWRIEPGDADRLASRLLDLLDDEPARRGLVEEGRRLMRDRTTTSPGADVAECLTRMVSGG